MSPAFCRTPRYGLPGTAPLPAKAWSGRGRPPKRMRRDAEHRPISVKELALACPSAHGARSSGAKAPPNLLSSRFARVRVRAAHRDYKRTESRPEEWLLIEWPKGETGADQILALDPSGRHRAFGIWSISPSCAGASSATIRNSSRKSGSGISKAADGAAFIITPRCASPPTDS